MVNNSNDCADCWPAGRTDASPAEGLLESRTMRLSAALPARLAWIWALPLLGLTGCASLAPKLEPPKLTVVGVELVSGDLLQQRFKARMRVDNPNDRSVKVRSISYTLTLGGEELGRGLSAAAFDIPASGSADFDMNVTADLAGTVLRLMDRARGKGLPDALTYRLRGEVKLAQGLARTIPFDETGTLRLR